MLDEKKLWGKIPTWMPKYEPDFSKKQIKLIDKYAADLEIQLHDKPARYRHSLSVAYTAAHMANLYGVDPYKAFVAGILHDWAKAYPQEIQNEKALSFGISFDVSLDLVKPLLHGPIAAFELPSRYPELSQDILQAISRHTLGNSDMSPLDMVIFVADGIEPLRKSADVLEAQRAMLKSSSLEEVFMKSFCDGIAYVIDTRRYLYPGTLNIYNEIVNKTN